MERRRLFERIGRLAAEGVFAGGLGNVKFLFGVKCSIGVDVLKEVAL